MSTLKTLPAKHCRYLYPYEEFSDHLKAMPTIRQWEYTWRFGHLGTAQTSRANNARVLEYFSDCYPEAGEAFYKAELLLSIYDYITRQAAFFSKKGMVEVEADGVFSVDPSLLRAVHHIFTASERPEAVEPKKVLALAKAFEEVELAD